MSASLSRLWCEKCAEESIHKRSVCIHCGTEHRGYQALRPVFDRGIGVSPRTRRSGKAVRNYPLTVLRGSRPPKAVVK